MNRKDFIKSSCGICVALSSGVLLTAVLDACKTPVGVVKATSVDNTVTIPIADFNDNPFKLVRVRDYAYDLAVQKKKDGTYEALVLMCTHAGQPLTKTGENYYYCTLHGSTFDHEGHVTKGPAEKDLARMPTQTKGDSLLIHIV